MRLSFFHGLVAALATACTITYAAQTGLDHNRFKWRDSAGNLHYSDTLPVDAAKLGYEVISPSGLIVKRVERAKTPEELAAAKAAQAKDKASRDAVDAKAHADVDLIAGYPEESDLDRSHQQKLELLDQQISSARISLRSQEQSLAEMLARAAEAEREKRTMSATELDQLAQMRKDVDQQRLALGRRENERNDAKTTFDLETAHYRELKSHLAEQPKNP